MGMNWEGPEVLANIDLIDTYFSEIALEDAGDGMVRIVRYVNKRGILVPVIGTVCPAAKLIEQGRMCTEFARKVLKGPEVAH